MNAPAKANENAATSMVFPPYFSTNIPEGIDMNPYAIKNANGRSETSTRLRLKLSMISGMIGPRIFERNEMTKNTARISRTI